MLDLVSTRTTTDPQAAACARLLAAVIASAIRDACGCMTREEKKNPGDVQCDARRALQFLFGEHSVFPLYAELIGANADTMRHALVHGKNPAVPGRFDMGGMDRRVLRLRLRRCGLGGQLGGEQAH